MFACAQLMGLLFHKLIHIFAYSDHEAVQPTSPPLSYTPFFTPSLFLPFPHFSFRLVWSPLISWISSQFKKCIRRSEYFEVKELSLCHKLWFSNYYIFGTKCCSSQIFQTMNSVRSNNLSLKYQRFTTSSTKDIEV